MTADGGARAPRRSSHPAGADAQSARCLASRSGASAPLDVLAEPQERQVRRQVDRARLRQVVARADRRVEHVALLRDGPVLERVAAREAAQRGAIAGVALRSGTAPSGSASSSGLIRNEPSLVRSVADGRLRSVKMRSGATSEIAKPCAFAPSHDGCGFDVIKPHRQIRIRLVEGLDLVGGRRSAGQRRLHARAPQLVAEDRRARSTPTRAPAASALTYAAREPPKLCRITAALGVEHGLRRHRRLVALDEPLEERAVRGLAIAGQRLQLRDRGVRQRRASRSGTASPRTARSAGPPVSDVSKPGPSCVGASHSDGERAHSHTHATWPFSGSCSPTLQRPHPHDHTDAIPVSAATCCSASDCHFATWNQAETRARGRCARRSPSSSRS